MHQPPPLDVDEILQQAREELLRIKEANEVGSITIHVGASQFVIEVNSKKPPVKRTNDRPAMSPEIRDRYFK